MNYWITTHWPRMEDESIDNPHAGVLVQDGKQHLIDQVAPQDLVFIYESKSGPAVIREYVDATTRKIARRRGREGIVSLVEVTDRAFQPKDSRPERYDDGTTLWWRYRAPTRSANSSGFLSRLEVAALLGFSERYVFRGFGDEHSGLKQVTEETFDLIRSAYNASALTEEEDRIAHASAGRFGEGGEGPEHLALKRRIAENPADLLREPGLTLWNEEWLLPTMDRIDLVLKDSLDRFVAVEVEVDCDATELPGPLQCMKYRAMLSYFFERPIEEVRCILAAHSIHSEVQLRCGHHSIEARVVAREALGANGGDNDH